MSTSTSATELPATLPVGTTVEIPPASFEQLDMLYHAMLVTKAGLYDELLRHAQALENACVTPLRTAFTTVVDDVARTVLGHRPGETWDYDPRRHVFIRLR